MFKTRLKKLEAAMASAANYEDWTQLARQHDKASGTGKWQAVDDSKHFDVASIRTRLDQSTSSRCWPQLERIRIQALISRTLDAILLSYEEEHLQQFGEKQIAAL